MRIGVISDTRDRLTTLRAALDACAADDIRRADVIVTGHAHEVSIETRDDKLFLNRGECCGWVTGRATIALLDSE